MNKKQIALTTLLCLSSLWTGAASTEKAKLSLDRNNIKVWTYQKTDNPVFQYKAETTFDVSLERAVAVILDVNRADQWVPYMGKVQMLSQAELKVLTRTPVILALLTTVLGAGAMFTLYTYIAPSLTEFTHASPTFITFMLMLIGVGFSVGNHLGGRFADLSINKTLIGFLVLLIVMMVTFPILAQSQIGAAIALVIWGAATFALVPPLQMRVMSVAHEAPGLASSVNIGAFNLGNAVGAAAGALVLDLGWGYSAVSFAGALLAGLGLLLVLFQIKRETIPAQALQQCSD